MSQLLFYFGSLILIVFLAYFSSFWTENVRNSLYRHPNPDVRRDQTAWYEMIQLLNFLIRCYRYGYVEQIENMITGTIAGVLVLLRCDQVRSSFLLISNHHVYRGIRYERASTVHRVGCGAFFFHFPMGSVTLPSEPVVQRHEILHCCFPGEQLKLLLVPSSRRSST